MGSQSTISLLTWADTRRFYDHLTLHIVAGPRSLSYFLPFALTFSALLAPPSVLSHNQIRWLVLPLIYAIQASIWIRHSSFDVISVNTVLTAFMLLGWYDVRRDFKYVRRLNPGNTKAQGSRAGVRPEKAVPCQGGDVDRDSAGPTEPAVSIPVLLETYPASMLGRIRWVITLFVSMRLTDWRIGVQSHDARQPCPVKPFRDFVAETVLQSMFCYVLFDFTSTCMALVPLWAGASGLPMRSLFIHGVAPVIHLAHFYAALALFNALIPQIISIVSLLLIPSLRYNSMFSPLTWPSHFGPLSSIYVRRPETPTQNLGLRAFWGIFWHQNMRYITSTPGVALSSTLGLKSGSKLRHMVIVISGFFWSGVIHMGVVPPQPVDTTLTACQMRFRVAAFFWLQIVGIGVEDLIQSTLDLRKRRRHALVSGQERSCAEKDDGKKAVGHRSVLKKIAIVLWTATFLASTAWWTVYPVGSEMNWWNLKILPTYLSGGLARIEW